MPKTREKSKNYVGTIDLNDDGMPKIGKAYGKIGDLVAEYLTYAETKVKANTLRDYRKTLSDYIDILVSESPLIGSDVTDDQHGDVARKALDALISAPNQRDSSKKLSTCAKNRKITHIKTFYSFLINYKQMPIRHPFSGVRKKKEEMRDLHFTAEIISSIKEDLFSEVMESGKTTAIRNYLVWAILSEIGLRGGECGAFTRHDIKINHDPVVIELRSAYTKTKETRFVPIPRVDTAIWGKRSRKKSDYQRFFEAYYNWHEEIDPEGDMPFFMTQKGLKGSPDTWNKAFKPYFAKYGIPKAHVHDLRKYAITTLLSRNVSTSFVQALAGHKSITMTARYTHLSPDVVAKTVLEALAQ